MESEDTEVFVCWMPPAHINQYVFNAKSTVIIVAQITKSTRKQMEQAYQEHKN